MGARVTHPSGTRTWPRSTRRTIEGSIAWMRMWKGGRKQGGRLGKGARKEVCSLTDASRNVQKGGSAARKCKCVSGHCHKSERSGGSAPQVGDLRLLEDGGERGGALVSEYVPPQTASGGWGGDGERVGVSVGIDRKANTLGRRRTLGW